MITYQVMRVFVSSASDVAEERRLAEEVIAGVSKAIEEPLGVLLHPLLWEDRPAVTSDPHHTIQDKINEDIERADVFVFILYRRYGTVESGRDKSNLEIEINKALDRLRTPHRGLTILSYFRELPENTDQGDQETRTRALANRLSQTDGVWHSDYRSPADFRERLTNDLYRLVLESQFLTKKHRVLKSFWELGTIRGRFVPSLAIIYPPVDTSFMQDTRGAPFWETRLAPHVVFEDHKAMQKIENGLRLIGFRNYRFCNRQHVPADVDQTNRVWLCLPRNPRGQRMLDTNYSSRARFAFATSTSRHETEIEWTSGSKGGRAITVRSPLSTYLALQRQGLGLQDWTRHMGAIYAKDYAVLARFSDTGSKPLVGGQSPLLKDYFFAGIRGLGTWGVGWFLDRRYGALEDRIQGPEHDVQLLLEVVYQDEHILDARDVSDEPADYFANELTMATIHDNIENYQRG